MIKFYIFFYLEKTIKSMRLKNLEQEILENEVWNKNLVLFEKSYLTYFTITKNHCSLIWNSKVK